MYGTWGKVSPTAGSVRPGLSGLLGFQLAALLHSRTGIGDLSLTSIYLVRAVTRCLAGPKLILEAVYFSIGMIKNLPSH